MPVPGFGLGRGVRLRSRSGHAIAAAWRGDGSRRIAAIPAGSGEVASWISGHPERGYLFEAPGVARFHLGPDGRTLDCSPPPAEREAWLAYLTGQALPFASVVRGLEVLHASAVAVDGAAFALIGASGSGKSTLAVNLHLAGAEFLTDDVLAVEVADEGLLAHPGLGWAKLRTAARDLVAGEEFEARAEPLCGNEVARRYALDRADGPVRLAAVYLLEPADVDEPVLLPERPSARRLLATTFNLVVETPERLVHQLEVCARIAAGRVVRALVPRRPGPDVARALLADASSRLAARPV